MESKLSYKPKFGRVLIRREVQKKIGELLAAQNAELQKKIEELKAK